MTRQTAKSVHGELPQYMQQQEQQQQQQHTESMHLIIIVLTSAFPCLHGLGGSRE